MSLVPTVSLLLAVAGGGFLLAVWPPTRSRFGTLCFAWALALTGLLFVLQRPLPPEPPDPTPPSRPPPPAGDHCLRIGLFEIGNDDPEPRLADEWLLGEEFAAEHRTRCVRIVRIQGRYLALGVRLPALPRRPPEVHEYVEVIRSFLEGRFARDPQGRLALDLKYDIQAPGSSASGKCGWRDLRAGHLLLLTGPDYHAQDGDWVSRFVLARVEGPRPAAGTLETWRRAIADAISDPGWRRGAVGAAALIPCPEARESLARLEGHSGLEFARFLAGDAGGVGNRDPDSLVSLGWQARTAWLQHPAVRPVAARWVRKQAGECPPGPVLRERLTADPELADLWPEPSGLSPMGERWAALALLLALAVAAVWRGVRAPVSPARCAGWMACGCSLMLLRVGVNFVDLTDLLGLPLLLGGTAGWFRAAARPSPALRLALGTAGALVLLEAWALLGAPAAVQRLGAPAFAALPTLLFVAFDDLPGYTQERSDRRALVLYTFAVLLPCVALALLDGMNQALGRRADFGSLDGASGWVLPGLAVVGLGATGYGFWALRRRLRRGECAVDASFGR